uniref:Uncharacterized protein n=1 Tax=Meloidogyne enterolobii TaxID=390850 RepID=A0A6V7W1C4_MELEN|nr:unnamed protein product [Meloidogyne enterolobii]
MKSSTAGLEKRKQSAKSMSAKSAPPKTSTASSHEMAPFFSIFYRGISSKINRSASKIDLDGQNEQIGVTSRKLTSADKPPIPSALKGAKGNNVADAAIYRRATAPSSGRSKSTVELAKEKAAAEGKLGEKMLNRSPVSVIKSTIGINSAPTSPQRQRRWPFNIRGSKAQSQEPTPFPVSQQQNGYHSNKATITSSQPTLLDTQQSSELPPPVPIRRKQGQQEELPQSSQINNQIQQQQQEAAPFITPKTSNTTTTFTTRPPPLPKISFDRLPPPSLPFAEKPPLSPSNSSLPMSFVQRIKLHKGVRTGKLPVDALKQQTPGFETGRGERFFASRRASKKAMPGAGIYMSADAIHELRSDPDYIVEALMAIGDEQPRVARSTPKHAYVSQDIKRVNDRLSRNCIYKSDVYEKMVNDSLLVCDMLQDHLDNVISGVRAKSPTALSSPFTTPPGSPFMTRSTSLHFPGSTAPINRVTISVRY